MKKLPTNVTLERYTAEFIATGFGSGLWPFIGKGTVAAAIAAIGFWFMPFESNSLWMLLLIGSSFVIGVWASSRNLKPGETDPSRTVIDEWCGVWISVVFLPKDIYWIAAAFVLFRVADVWKPLGIRRLERLPYGWGIMADDVAAGIGVAVVLNIIRVSEPLQFFAR